MRHHDDRLDTEELAGQRDTLGMVPGRVSDDTGFLLFRRQGRNFIIRSPEFKCADSLKAFSLEVYVVAGNLVEGVGGEEGSLVSLAAYDLVGRFDIGEGNQS